MQLRSLEMKQLLAKFKELVKYALSYLPHKLPVGLTEFHNFSDSIIELSGEYADRDSLKFAIATMILHAGEARGSLSKQYFVRRLRKVAANQVAGQVFTDIKEKQKAAQEAMKAGIKQVEDTTASKIESSNAKEKAT